MTARDVFDRWIESLQILAGDADNPTARQREQMRVERARFLAANDAERRAALAEEFAAALLAVDPVEWALAGQHAGADAAALVRRVAATPTSKEQKR